MMNRELAIQLLLQHELQRVENGRTSFWLMQALDRGFRGFSNLTDEELMESLRQRGLDGEDCADSLHEPDFDGEEAFAEADLDGFRGGEAADY